MIVLDFETRSESDLKSCGASVYASNPSTDIICMAWAIDKEEPELWLPFDSFPDKVKTFILSGHEVYAHNYMFDRAIWNSVAIPKYGFSEIPDSQWRCSMAQAYWMGLPGSLEKAALAAGIDAKKDMKASRVMKRISQPRSVSDKGDVIWWDDEAKLKTTYEYCLQDLRVTQQLIAATLPLPKAEIPVFELDREINDRGVKVDMVAVEVAIAVVDLEKIRLDTEMWEATAGFVSKCSEVGKLTSYIRKTGLEIEGVSKPAIEELLNRTNLPHAVRQVLLLRQESAKASTAKLEAMQARVGADGRIRGAQLQNLRRSTLLTNSQIDEAIAMLTKTDNPDKALESFFGPPMAVLADCIRGFLVPKSGYIFQAGDFSSIEARVLAWLAGEEKTLEVFRGHGKIYEATAGAIFNVHIDAVTKDQRQVGKTACLACGYGGGVGAFQKMAVNYGVKVSDEKAEIIKKRWREANPRIVRYWYDLDNAARVAIKNPGSKCRAGAAGREVTFLKNGTFLLCKLPSSRVLFYPYPKIEEVETPWGEMKFAVTYRAESSQTRQWERQNTFPGVFAEHCTQSLSRDLLAEAMLRMRNSGEKIVLHSHDEIVCETYLPHAQIEVLKRKMSEVPSWATGLPIEVKMWEGYSYRKE